MKQAPKKFAGARTLEFAQDIAGIFLKASALLAVLSAAYLIWGLTSKGVQSILSMPAWAQKRVIANVNIATTVYELSTLVLIISLVIRNYADDILGYILSLAGIGLYFGVPYLVGYYFGQNLEANAVILITLQSARVTAVFAFMPGVLLIIRDIFIRISFAMARPISEKAYALEIKEEKYKDCRKYPIWAKCWQMPYCSDFVRKVCPAWEKRKSCWKIKRGCQCDDATILRAMGSVSFEEKQQRELAWTMNKKSDRYLTPSQRRDRCKTCAIYLEHQRQKFRILSALVVPTVVIIVGGTAGLLRNSLREMLLFTEKVMQFASFEPQKSVSYNWLSSGGDIVYLQWIFMVWVCIITMSYALQLLEYCIFKLKI